MTLASWRLTVLRDRDLLERLPRGQRGLRLFDEIGPRLVDTIFREQVRQTVRAIEEPADGYPGISYTRGVLENASGNRPVALRHFMRARACAPPGRHELIARLALELGRLHLLRLERAAADMHLAWAESRLAEPETFADLLLLQAFIAKNVGDHRKATPLLRAVIAARRRLTPISGVLALTNLAIGLHHERPHEGLALCRLALESIEDDLLHESARPAARNILGYALICAGDLDDARFTLNAALSECGASNEVRVRLFAAFNLAIVDELQGSLDQSADRLRSVAREAAGLDFDDLVQWTEIRLRWLDLRARGDWRRALEGLERPFPDHFASSVETLRALALAAAGEVIDAQPKLSALAASYTAKNDFLTSFAIHLWVAHLHHGSGRDGAARRSLRDATEIGRAGGFCLSPNWWAPQIVQSARETAPRAVLDYVESLRSPLTPVSDVSTVALAVRIEPDGSIWIDDQVASDDIWRRGRSGPGLLRRYFRLLLQARGGQIPRERLTSVLWPRSRSDVAVRNLYWATRDLRRALASVPGLSLSVEAGVYSLRMGQNVKRRVSQ